ncbi:mucolipin-3-like isoform X2 [Dendronephthya gigantea]|uniref:mucolipin-3-like isoform X2 n=1 Tax=Dendronephthya gigantea TaxID=151771 RepID=UPI00106C4FB1|nr:mucolipin-3-like isoform X2 [Dendronephthya gigantea]
MAKEYESDQEQSLFYASGFTNHYGAVNSVDLDGQSTEALSEKMRARLKWHYMNAYEKYRAGGRKPWKLLIQIIKIILVTVQICWFAELRFSVVMYLDEAHHVFHGLLFRNNGNAFYTRQSLYHQINYTTFQYEHIEELALGPYSLPCENPGDCPVVLCTHSYNNSTIKPRTLYYEFGNDEPEVKCMNITTIKNKNISEFVRLNNIPQEFYCIDAFSLRLTLQSIKIGQLKFGNNPECVRFKIKINFHNGHNTGKFKSEMEITQEYIDCKVPGGVKDELRSSEVIYDIFVIVVCFWSLLLTIRSLYRNFKLAKLTFKFFKRHKKEKLSIISDGLELVNAWYIIIVLTDILTIVGSVIKIYIDMKNLKETYFYDECSLCLGISVLFIWIGILRYVGFLKKYNVLLITIEAAMPSVLRFLTCAAVLYFGFLFCGWIVIGPYHPKFTSLSETSECLYSLINGDDMYPTFHEMSKDNYQLWIFSKIYLYVFISLFIYIVLSLFIGIISDTYERLKNGQHIVCSNVRRFIHGPECPCFNRSESTADSRGHHSHARARQDDDET